MRLVSGARSRHDADRRLATARLASGALSRQDAVRWTGGDKILGFDYFSGSKGGDKIPGFDYFVLVIQCKYYYIYEYL